MASNCESQVNGAGSLHAFDSSDLTRELWNSNQNPARDAMGNLASFTTPVVANGKVYVPTLSNQLVVYGLINGPIQGDVDGDNAVSCADLAIVRTALGTSGWRARFDARADVVRDGIINARDISLVSGLLPPRTTCP